MAHFRLRVNALKIRNCQSLALCRCRGHRIERCWCTPEQTALLQVHHVLPQHATSQGRTNPVFSKPCLFLSDTGHFRHSRRFQGSEERSPCSQWVECKFVIFAVFVKTAPFRHGTKTRFTKNSVCATPNIVINVRRVWIRSGPFGVSHFTLNDGRVFIWSRCSDPQLLETNLASHWEGVGLRRAFGKSWHFPGSSPNFPGSSLNFPGSSPAASPEGLSLCNLTAIQRFHGSFPDFPGSSPDFTESSPDLPEGQPLSLESLTHSPDSQKLSLDLGLTGDLCPTREIPYNNVCP